MAWVVLAAELSVSAASIRSVLEKMVYSVLMVGTAMLLAIMGMVTCYQALCQMHAWLTRLLQACMKAKEDIIEIKEPPPPTRHVCSPCRRTPRLLVRSPMCWGETQDPMWVLLGKE